MKPLRLVLILPCVLLSLSAFAEESMIQPQTQGEVSFVSGGVGFEERAELQAIHSNYNLSLLFSEQGGDYLSDVKVRITDLSGNTLLEAVSDGPKMFVRLRPGRYTVTTEYNGKTFQKTVAVSNHQQPPLSFVWPQEQKD